MTDSPESAQQNCIFCHIVSGKVQSKKIYEDEETVGILDINPANPGHVLLLPKKHHAIMPQMNDLEIGHIFMVSKAISGALLKALKAEGTNIFVANGAIAGQKAPHFMVHVIPRKEGDGVGMSLQENKISLGELVKVRDMLLPRIKENLKLSDEAYSSIMSELGSPASRPEHGQAQEKTVPEQKMDMPEMTAPEQKFAMPEKQMVTPEKIPMRQEAEYVPVDLDAISTVLNRPAYQAEAEPDMGQAEKPQEKTRQQDAQTRKKPDDKKKVTLDQINRLFKNGM